MDEKGIEKIVLHYDDGTTETVDKGFIASLTSSDDETCEITFHMAHISGNELCNMIEGVATLGIKLGLFGGDKNA